MSFLLLRDYRFLAGVHPALAATVIGAARLVEEDGRYCFRVCEGLRTSGYQKALVERGASQKLDSYHLHGVAVDLAILSPDRSEFWQKDTWYRDLNRHMQVAGKSIGFPPLWGGNWTHFKDFMHWQIEAEWDADLPLLDGDHHLSSVR